MIVLSHRGHWLEPAEKNQAVAFHRSFDGGFGTETDVRDRLGSLVIAHDMASSRDMSFDAFLDILGDRRVPLALNIKADGLAQTLADLLAARGYDDWFTFDMSVPEMVVQIRLGMPVYTRCSDVETKPVCYEQSRGVWLDAFHSEWFGSLEVEQFLRDGKRVCIVSPELHGRDPTTLWSILASSPVRRHPNLMICTDRPIEAQEHLGN